MYEINEKTRRRSSRPKEETRKNQENKEIIKIQLEQWINDLQKEVDCNYKPKPTFKNDNKYIKSLSQV